jgi:hypothetical protein
MQLMQTAAAMPHTALKRADVAKVPNLFGADKTGQLQAFASRMHREKLSGNLCKSRNQIQAHVCWQHTLCSPNLLQPQNTFRVCKLRTHSIQLWSIFQLCKLCKFLTAFRAQRHNIVVSMLLSILACLTHNNFPLYLCKFAMIDSGTCFVTSHDFFALSQICCHILLAGTPNHVH